MARRHLTFACEGETLLATLDDAPGRVALLIVTGGNETRAGAWSGQARLAARLAQAGWPVLRFDRRGVADSTGENTQFRSSAPDIAAAIATLRSLCPQVARVVAFGNCDAAAALMLTGGVGCDALLLSNPWTIEKEEASDAQPVEVTRAHYRKRLRDPAAIRRLLSGKVALKQLASGLLSTLRPQLPAHGSDTLLADLQSGIAGFSGSIRFLVAESDRTGQTFLARWNKADPRIERCARATHSYVEPEAQEWLYTRIEKALEAEAASAL